MVEPPTKLLFPSLRSHELWRRHEHLSQLCYRDAELMFAVNEVRQLARSADDFDTTLELISGTGTFRLRRHLGGADHVAVQSVDRRAADPADTSDCSTAHLIDGEAVIPIFDDAVELSHPAEHLLN